MNRTVGVLALLALGAAATWLASRSPASPAPATSPEVLPPRPAAMPAQAAPPATSLPATGDDQLLLPDGTRTRCLNGARGAPPLQEYWGNRPFAPIVAVERSDVGVDWYVHADGTRSTTEMKWRADLGRLDAVTRVAIPGPVPGPAGAR